MVSRWIRGRHPAFQHRSQLAKGVRTLAAFLSVRTRISGAIGTGTPASGDGDRERISTAEPHVEAQRRWTARPTVRRPVRGCDATAAQVPGQASHPRGEEGAGLRDRETTTIRHRGGPPGSASAHRLRKYFTACAHGRPRSHHSSQRPLASGEDVSNDYAYDRVRPLDKEDLSLLIALLHQPYPIIRAIRSRKSTVSLQSVVPSKARVEAYVRQLKSLW